MKKKFHVIMIFLIVLGLIIEIMPLGMVSAISGVVVLILSLYYLNTFVKLKKTKSAMLIAFVIILATYLFSKPYLHYSIHQFSKDGFIGNPHNHAIWDAGHIH